LLSPQQNAEQILEKKKIENRPFENVAQFRYLVKMIKKSKPDPEGNSVKIEFE
jgi:hypothetical protein